MIELQTDHTTDRRDAPARPLALFIAIIRDKGGTWPRHMSIIQRIKFVSTIVGDMGIFGREIKIKRGIEISITRTC